MTVQNQRYGFAVRVLRCVGGEGDGFAVIGGNGLVAGEPLLVVDEDELLPQPLSNSAALMPSTGKSFWDITVLFIGVYDTEYT